MILPDFIDLCSDDEIGESKGKDVKKEQNSAAEMCSLKGKYNFKKVQLLESENKFLKQESVNDITSNALSPIQSKPTVLDQRGSLADESNLCSAPPFCSAPISRQFWKAGDYESGQNFKAETQNGKNNLRIHPLFLHSNATSHKWVFGAIAELLDNAVDEIQNGATFVTVDKILNPRNGSPALVVQDDGGGMDPETIRRCMSFGYSDKKMKVAIGQYGNGFKTSSMRLGADAIVFSRHMKKRTSTQSIGLLSYTFLRQAGHDRIVVPMVDYEVSSVDGSIKAIHPHGKESFSSNLSTLLQWAPYLTEEELLKQFDDIGNHGTKVIVYNLWLKDDGNMELDFDSNTEDIRISGDAKFFQATDHHADPIKDQHIANMYRYSLRAYSSILYLRIPQSFRIILRGQIVDHRNIANDLIYPELVLYKPQLGHNVEANVITTIGFLKESPRVSFHGFNVYHRNRLIMPFWRVVKITNNTGSGVVGVLEANFMEPTHNKQDFEKTSLFQKLESRLKDMTIEYWHLHCALIGHQQKRKNFQGKSVNRPPQELPSRSPSFHEPVVLNHNSHGYNSPRTPSAEVGSFRLPVATPSIDPAKRVRPSVDGYQIKSLQELPSRSHSFHEPVWLNHNSHGYNSPRTPSAEVGSFHLPVATPSTDSAKRVMPSVDGYQIKSLQELPSRSRSFHEPVLLNHNSHRYNSPRTPSAQVGSFHLPVATPSTDSAKRVRPSVDDYQLKSPPGFNVKTKEHNSSNPHNGTTQPTGGTENLVQVQETISLLRENKKLQSQLSETEKREEMLKLKVQRLRKELEAVMHTYTKLLDELKSIGIM